MKLAIIPARSGSKRISRKNIRMFAGRPLIAWSIIRAIESELFDRVIVSTDDQSIADIALKYGAEVPFIRPAELADDYVKIRPVLRHTLRWFRENNFSVSFVCCIFPTAPFIEAEDLKLGLEKLITNNDRIILPISKYSSPIQRALTIDKTGAIKPVWQDKIKERSQDLEPTYFDAGQFYWATEETFLQDSDALLSEKSLGIILPNNRTQDIDTEDDFIIAEKKFLELERAKVMPKISIGTANFAQDYGVSNTKGQIDSKELNKIFKLMNTIGVNKIDTAPSYGTAEKILGNIGVDNYEIMSKLPSIPNDLGDVNSWVEEQVDAILQDLSVEKIYGISFHDPFQLLDSNLGQKAHRALKSLQKKGMIEKIGVSIYDPSILNNLTKNIDIDIVQAPLNIFDRRIVESGWLQKLKSQDIEVVVRSIFLQGLLLMESEDKPSFFKKWEKNFDLYDEWLSKHSISRVEACLHFVFSFSEIDRIIIGIDSASQLLEISNFFKPIYLDCPTDLSSNDQQLIDPNNWKI